MSVYMIYGANGFTGQLLAQAAQARGQQPILAGRRDAAVRAIAEQLGMPYRVFDLHDDATLDQQLIGVQTVINCAGPFAHTAARWVDACLRNRVHYVDICGEYRVFEHVAQQHAAAQAQGVLLLCGMGFDVTPTDCLAAHLKTRLPSATDLHLAVHIDMVMSAGTAVTTIESIGQPSMLRRHGVLQPIPMGSYTRRIPFAQGNATAVALPLGELCSAYHSTGIGNISMWVAQPWPIRWVMRFSPWLAPLLRQAWLQRWLKALMRLTQRGPSAKRRHSGHSQVWGEAYDGQQLVRSHLLTPDHYQMTAEFAIEAASRCIAGHIPSGYHSPASAFGADFVLGFAGVSRLDDPIQPRTTPQPDSSA